jgi:hypothetical protein
MIVHARLAAGYRPILVEVDVDFYPAILGNRWKVIPEKGAGAIHLRLAKLVEEVGADVDA